MLRISPNNNIFFKFQDSQQFDNIVIINKLIIPWLVKRKMQTTDTLNHH